MGFNDYRSLSEIAEIWAKDPQAPGDRDRLRRVLVEAICDGAFFDDGLAVRAHALLRSMDPEGEGCAPFPKQAESLPDGSIRAVAGRRVPDFETPYIRAGLHAYLGAAEDVPASAAGDPEVFFDWVKHTDPSSHGAAVHRLFDHIVINMRAFRNWCQAAGRVVPGFVADWPGSRPLDPNHRGTSPLPEMDLISLCEAVTWLTTGRARPAAVLKRLMLRHRGRRWPRGLWRELEEDAERLVTALRNGDVTGYGQLEGGPHVAIPLDYFASDVFAEFALDVIAPDPLAFERGTYPDGLPTYRSVRFRRNDLWAALRQGVRKATTASPDTVDTPHARSWDSAAPRAFEVGYWNLLQTLAWVYLADRGLVEEAGGPGTGVIVSKQVKMPDGSIAWVAGPDYPPTDMMLVRDDEHPDRRYACLSDAVDAVVSELASGRITAIGLRNNLGDPSQIPREFWIDARFTYEPETACPRDLFRPGASRWFALRFPREQILAVWPENNLSTVTAASSSGPRLSFLVLARRWLADQSGTGLTIEDVAVDLVRAAEDGAFTSRPLEPASESLAYDAQLGHVVHTVDQQGEPQGPHWIRNYIRAGVPGGEHGRRLNAARDLSVDLPAVAAWLATDAGAEWARLRGLMTPGLLLAADQSPRRAGEPVVSLASEETKCRQWLLGLMKQGEPVNPKARYREQALREWQISIAGFDRSWAWALEETGNTAWKRPGRKSTRPNRIAN